jgi:hypothetical protein
MAEKRERLCERTCQIIFALILLGLVGFEEFEIFIFRDWPRQGWDPHA